MFTSKGGLKKKNRDKMGFQPVLDMIRAPGTTFNVLTITSLMGFMIVMNVVGDNYEYTTHNDTFSSLNIPVTKYLLKFSIVDDDKERSLDEFNDNEKESDTKRNFFLEAQFQKALWISSLSSGRVPICPSVANIAFFKDRSISILDMIVSKATNLEERVKLQAISDYLIDQKDNKGFKSVRSIGLITQNLLTSIDGRPAKTLESVLEDGSISQDDKKKIVIYAAAQVLRLYLNYRTIHCDLHLQNFLVTDDKCFIIDFGRVYNFLNEDYYPDPSTYPPGITEVFPRMYQPEDRLSVVESVDINFEDKEENVTGVYDNTIKYIESRTFEKLNDIQKNNFIERIFLYDIIKIDLSYQKYSFGEYVQFAKLRDLMQNIDYFNNGNIYYEIYQKYLQLSRVDLSKGTKKINISELEKLYERDFSNGGYDINGGKNKTYKRYNKRKTNKRYKRHKKRRTNKRH